MVIQNKYPDSRLKWKESSLQVNFWKAGLTNDADARLSFLLAQGENIEDAAVASLVIRPHLVNGDEAGVIVRGGEPHVGIFMADAGRHTLLIRQEDLAPVEPAHLPDGATCCRGDVTAKQEGTTCLCVQIGRSDDFTWDNKFFTFYLFPGMVLCNLQVFNILQKGNMQGAIWYKL